MNLSHCLSSLWPGFNSQPWQIISRDFSLADHTLPIRPEPTWQENGSISPQWHHATCGYRGGRPKSNHGQTMAEVREKERKTTPGTPRNTAEHRGTPRAPRNTGKHCETPRNTAEHRGTPRNTGEHCETPRNTGELHGTLGNSTEHRRTLRNTAEHRRTVR